MPQDHFGEDVAARDDQSVGPMFAADGSQRIEVTIGDIATTRVGGSFRLVYLVFNTIGNPTTQDQQVACFANAAARSGSAPRSGAAFSREPLSPPCEP